MKLIPEVAVISEINKKIWENLAGKIVEALEDSEDPVKIILIYDTESVLIGTDVYEKFKPKKVIIEFYRKVDEKEIDLKDIEEEVKRLDELI